MLWSKTLIPTLKETPQEALIKSHRLMLRAGLVRKLASGTYTYLPLGLRALKKAETIVREEMDKAGALELLLPALHPAELWKETGRYEIMGEDMVHFKDRHGKENVLGPTHEEVITDLARREIRSYKQLPLLLYQIQTKFRDEMRPRSGVIRSREFIMKDAYSFHPSKGCLDKMYDLMKETYKKIFTRCGLDFHVVVADPGAMGGSGSQEFVLFSDAGEDRMVQYGEKGKVLSVEMAERVLKNVTTSDEKGKSKKVHTPGHSSVESVATLLKKTPQDLVKTMIYENSATKRVFAVLVRGDHEVSDFKVRKKEPGSHLASRDTIDKVGSAFGFSGPIGLKLPLYIDADVMAMKNFITGANEPEQHLVDVNVEDFKSTDSVIGDFRHASEGDQGLVEGQPVALQFKTAIELGHIFKLNLRYSEPMGATFLDASGKANPVIMGCYGIGVNRILAAAIEQYGDDKGIIWPKNIAPYQLLVVMLEPNDAQSKEIVEQVLNSKELKAKGVDILVDDRQETAGYKFNDADLIGLPLRLVLGPKNLKNGKAELKVRKTGETVLVDIPEIPAKIAEILDKIP